MPIYDFKCTSCANIKEHIVRIKDRGNTKECPDCGGTSEYQIGTPQIKLEGISGDFPTAHDRWAKLHSKRAMNS